MVEKWLHSHIVYLFMLYVEIFLYSVDWLIPKYFAVFGLLQPHALKASRMYSSS